MSKRLKVAQNLKLNTNPDKSVKINKLPLSPLSKETVNEIRNLVEIAVQNYFIFVDLKMYWYASKLD